MRVPVTQILKLGRLFTMKFIIAFIYLILISISAFSQTTETKWKVEDGWKGLLPLISTRADFEKLFGKGVRLKNSAYYQYRYETEEAIIEVDYAQTRCDKNSNGVNRFDIPENTVTRYQIILKGQAPTAELTFDKNRFERSVSESQVTEVELNKYRFERTDPQNQNKEPAFAISYHQFKEELSSPQNEWSSGVGISFWGIAVQDVDYVRGFSYGPSYDDLEKRRCEK
jgi:hypothetical protein